MSKIIFYKIWTLKKGQILEIRTDPNPVHAQEAIKSLIFNIKLFKQWQTD